MTAGRARVLVTGASGLLGGRLARHLAARHEVVGARHRRPIGLGLPEVVLDLEDQAALERGLEDARPDAVVHSAAMAQIDTCEQEPQRALTVNVAASATVARWCHARGVRLVALSTDLVFAGGRSMVSEDDPPGPLMTYARTKLAGEDAVLGEAPGAAVARVALVIGRGHGHRGTASESLAWSLRAGRTVRLFTDEFRTPVDADSVAEAIGRLLEGQETGRFHLGGPERLSRYDLGLRVAARLGLPASSLIPARHADEPALTPRPADASLDHTRARRVLGFVPAGVDDAIGRGRAAPD